MQTTSPAPPTAAPAVNAAAAPSSASRKTRLDACARSSDRQPSPSARERLLLAVPSIEFDEAVELIEWATGRQELFNAIN
jgi:hypothetical protein